MNKIKERRKAGAVCPKCKSPDYRYKGKDNNGVGKHKFECNSCGFKWTYGRNKSKYTKLV